MASERKGVDYVALEVALALKRGSSVFPVSPK